MLVSSTTNIQSPIDISEIDMQEVEYFQKNDKTTKHDLPQYIGVIRDENHQIIYINPQKYIVQNFVSNSENLKNGIVYKIKKGSPVSLKKLCNFNQVHDNSQHFAKIIFASSDYLPKEVRGQTRYYAGLMAENNLRIAEENDDLESASKYLNLSTKWFDLSADEGYCLATFRLGLLAQKRENDEPFVTLKNGQTINSIEIDIPLSSSEYFNHAKDLADLDSPEMKFIERTLDPKNLPSQKNVQNYME